MSEAYVATIEAQKQQALAEMELPKPKEASDGEE